MVGPHGAKPRRRDAAGSSKPIPLARIRMALELGRLARADGCDELVYRLDDVTDAPWPAVRLPVRERFG